MKRLSFLSVFLLTSSLVAWSRPVVISVPLHHCGFDVNIGLDPMSPRIRVSEDGSKVWVVFLDMWYYDSMIMIAMSEDSGKTWLTPQPIAHPPYGVESPLVQSWGNQYVYALGLSREITISVWKSSDAGETWTLQDTTGKRPLYAALELQNEDTLHLAYGSNDSTEGIYYQRSFDGGITWEPKRLLLRKHIIVENEGGDTLIEWPTNLGEGFILFKNPYVHIMWVIVTTYPNGEEDGSLIYMRSEDEGENLDTLFYTHDLNLAPDAHPQIDPVTGAIWVPIIYGNQYMMMKSVDNGETWQFFNINLNNFHKRYVCAQFRVYNNHIFMAYRRRVRHIYFTTSPDGGITWSDPELIDSLVLEAGQMGIPDLEVVPLGNDSFLIHLVYAEVDTFPDEPGIYGRIIYRRSARKVGILETDNQHTEIPKIRWWTFPGGVRFVLPKFLIGKQIYITDVSGRVIWENNVSRAGLFEWRGETRYGGRTASGVYYLSISGYSVSPTRFIYIKQ